MGQTRQEIRRAWDRKNLRQYMGFLHRTHDADKIAFIESQREKGYSINQIFKRGIEKLMESEND